MSGAYTWPIAAAILTTCVGIPLALTLPRHKLPPAAGAKAVAKPGPMMVDLRISRSVPSVPYRRLHYGRDE